MSLRTLILIFLSFVFCNITGFAQDDDSYGVKEDSISEGEASSDEAELFYAPADTIAIDQKSFSDDTFRELKSDPELNYTIPPTVGQSLWQRFLQWIGEILSDLFDGAVSTNWGRVLVYVVGLIVIIVIVMMILKVDAFRVLFFGAGAKQKYQVLEENIHEMDFDKLIQEAVQQNDFRRGVRLLFLYALKMLSDRHMIHWEVGKTNHDYLAEVKSGEVKPGFSRLSYFFDYAWYGNFAISRQTFEQAQDAFSQLKGKLGAP